jgi:hypothetical protein
MTWLMIVITLAGGRAARARTAIWRDLHHIAAAAVGSGAYVLPDRPESRAAFDRIAGRVRAAGGSASQFVSAARDADEDARVIARFHAGRAALAEPLIARVSQLQRPGADALRSLQRVARQAQVIAAVDYFEAPACAALAREIRAARSRLEPAHAEPLADVPIARYRGRVWVTAARPSVDALACAWLIRRFVDASAQIKFGSAPRGSDIAFDLDTGEFAHHGQTCAFERMVFAFRLDSAALTALGEIVHDLVMSDRRVRHPETAGLAAAVRGWRQSGQLSAVELEARARALFDGLYADFHARKPLRAARSRRSVP